MDSCPCIRKFTPCDEIVFTYHCCAFTDNIIETPSFPRRTSSGNQPLYPSSGPGSKDVRTSGSMRTAGCSCVEKVSANRQHQGADPADTKSFFLHVGSLLRLGMPASGADHSSAQREVETCTFCFCCCGSSFSAMGGQCGG